MLRYYTTGILVALLLLFSLHGASLGLDGEDPVACIKETDENSSLCTTDTIIDIDNRILHSKYPLNVFRSLYGAISRVDGNRCPMHPTCSRYSLEAIEKHGFLIGIVMTCDRLIHESNEMDYAPLVEVGDSVKYADPVENNDFWWSD